MIKEKEGMELTILSLGAGVQSTVLALMACRGELEHQPDHIIFSDTGDESRATYKHLEWLEGIIRSSDIQYHKVTGGNIRQDVVASMVTKESIKQPPFFTKGDDQNGILRRKCTSQYKLDPIKKCQRKILGLKKGQRMPKGLKIIKLLGISTDEVSRMKPSRDKWEDVHWPLIDMGMSRWSCYKWLQDNGYKVPPRSSCLICPHHSNAYWRDMKDNSPDEFSDVCEFDDKVRFGIPAVKYPVYLHRSCTPLREVDLSTDIDHGQFELDLYAGECEGICGT